MKTLVFVVYDGIKNPVFQGQVIAPILKKLNTNIDLNIQLICFEKVRLLEHDLNNLIPKHPRLNFIQFKRYPVIGKISLMHSVYILRKVLNKLNNYSIKARGPLAGWVTLHAINKNKCANFIVQARGLIAIEYEMHLNKKNFLHRLREKIFNNIEKEIYKPSKALNNFKIESISPALSEYLIKHYHADYKCIILANEDIPEPIDSAQKANWRKEIKDLLAIKDNTHVYCYNGSAKPWQDINLTIDFFKDKLKENPNIFLLILTQDKDKFEELLDNEKIDKTKYKVLSIKHTDIYKYLSACDTGLLFRKKHLANWISRPIKAMEYKAVGLNILHNDTVKWLIDQK